MSNETYHLQGARDVDETRVALGNPRRPDLIYMCVYVHIHTYIHVYVCMYIHVTS